MFWGYDGGSILVPWAMMKLEGLDPTTVVMVNSAHELMKRNEQLEEELKAQKEARKRSQKMGG